MYSSFRGAIALIFTLVYNAGSEYLKVTIFFHTVEMRNTWPSSEIRSSNGSLFTKDRGQAVPEIWENLLQRHSAGLKREWHMKVSP